MHPIPLLNDVFVLVISKNAGARFSGISFFAGSLGPLLKLPQIPKPDSNHV